MLASDWSKLNLLSSHWSGSFSIYSLLSQAASVAIAGWAGLENFKQKSQVLSLSMFSLDSWIPAFVPS